MRCLLLLYAYIKSLKFAYFTNQIDISTHTQISVQHMGDQELIYD